MKNFKLIKNKNFGELPKTSGVYSFYGKNELLYIGKAINIQNRVKNHFNQPSYRDDLFIDKVDKIGFFETGSEIEALVFEANLIKKYQPKFNVVWRDDKNYFYVAISQNEQKIPYIFITHQKNYEKTKYVGPFVEGTALKKTLRFLRRAFPYYTVKKHPKTKCTYCHLSLCPGPDPDKNLYKKNINNLVAILEGKKQKVLRDLKKDMKKYSQNRDFENAAKARDQILSLEKIISHAHIFEANKTQQAWPKTEGFLQTIMGVNKKISRIEGYDISNIQGNQAVASMVVFIDGTADKNQYRKFKIKTIEGPNDTAMIKEALSRRITHNEWPMPDLIFIDGGKGQLNAALAIIHPHTKRGDGAGKKINRSESRSGVGVKEIPVCALAKKNNELFIKGNKDPVLLKTLPREIFNLILQIRDESHRFAITYHKKLRKKHLLTE